MTDIPIIFSAPMVQALIAGRKTMTRRLAWRSPRVAIQVGEGPVEPVVVPTPWQRVKAGDRLWVRESFRPNDIFPDEWSRIIYRADVPKGALGPWKPSIHCPRIASRLTLIVTGTKVEPLWQISERDCLSEGVELESADPPFYYVPGIMPHSLTAVGIEERGDLMPHAVQSFRKLWMMLHGRAGWDKNPDVVALSFKVTPANIDQVSPSHRTHVGALARNV